MSSPKKISKFLLGILFAISSQVSAQSIDQALNSINEKTLKAQLTFLSSDWMEGRESETRGAYLAGDYIASMFQNYGIEPMGDIEYSFPKAGQKGGRPEANPSYFQKFDMVKYKMSDKQSLSLIHDFNGSRIVRTFNYGIDYSLYGVETDLEIDAPVVFVGYGIRLDSLKYNDFAKVDVRGKIILRLEGYPGFRDTTCASYKKLKMKNLWNDKEKWALEAGAVGVISLSSYPNKDFGKVLNTPYKIQGAPNDLRTSSEKYYDKKAVLVTDSITRSIPMIRVSSRLQNEFAKMIGINLLDYELESRTNLKSGSKELTGSKIGLKCGVTSELVSVRNVLGMIEGEKKDEFIVVGAHYDHIGTYNGQIYNGADDNGSGTVGMMAIARAMKLSGKKPAKTVIFAAWTAEEKGLLGSDYFTRTFPGLYRIGLDVNFDMIGRNSLKDTLGNNLDIEYTKSYKGFETLLQKKLNDQQMGLRAKFTASDRPSGGSDFAPFAARDIPVISYMSGMHPDYHQPSDKVEKIEWEKMTKIVRLGFLSLYDLANTDLKEFKTNPEH